MKSFYDSTTEKPLLGGILRDWQNFPPLKHFGVKEEWFLFPAHQEIWTCMEILDEKGIEIEMVTVANLLKERKKIEDVGYDYLIALHEEASATQNILFFAEKLKENYLSCELYNHLNDVAKDLERGKRRLSKILNTSALYISSLENQFSDAGEGLANQGAGGWEEFPLHAFPTFFSDYVNDAASALPVNPVLVGMPAMILGGSLVGNRYRIKVKGGFPSWSEPGIYWGIIVAHPSQKKTPSQTYACFPARTIEENLWQEWVQIEADYKNALKVHAREGEGLKGQALGDHLRNKPEQPPRQRLIVDDITIESLADVLSENPKGLLLLKDEIVGWFNSFARYIQGGSGSSDVDKWLSIFNGVSIVSDRKTGDKKSIAVNRACVSVYGGIQPAVLAKYMTNNFFDNGFAARILFAMPPRHVGGWVEKTVDPGFAEEYNNTFRKMFWDNAGNEDPKHFQPMVIEWSKQAKDKWVPWVTEWNNKASQSEGEISSALSKLEGYTPRFALLLWALDYHNGGTKKTEILSRHIEGAIILTEWFANEAQRIYRVLREKPEKRERNTLLEYILSRQGKITPSELHKSNDSKYPTTAAAEAALQNLVNEKMGVWVQQTAGPKGGRPTRVFVAKAQKPRNPESPETSRNGKVG